LKRQIIKRLGNSEIQDVWETASFKSPEDYSTYLALSGDSIYLLCLEKIYEYDLTGQLRRSFPSEVGEPSAMDISCDGRFLLAAGSLNAAGAAGSVLPQAANMQTHIARTRIRASAFFMIFTSS